MESPNPLRQPAGPPRFDEIRPEHVVPAIEAELETCSQALATLESDTVATWKNLIEPLERLHDRLERTWGVVSHLMGVRNSGALRQAYEDAQPKVVEFSMRVAQSVPLFQALTSLREGPEWSELEPSQQYIVTSLLRDAELAGVGLAGPERKRFNQIQLELAELSTRFSNHVLDSTKAWSLRLTRRDQVEGLPESLLELAAQAERDAEDSTAEGASASEGPWRITLDAPSLSPFLEHSRRRDLREQLYRAYVARASSGELDNTPLIERILKLRKEQALLLGYASYAELSLAAKMAPSVKAVETLLEELRSASFEVARQELDELRAVARSASAAEAEDLNHWDVPFWAERLREQRFAYTDEELRPYFPLPGVLDGLFSLAKRLFGVEIVAADGSVPVWHPDVRYFHVRDQSGERVAAFYLDPYSRPAEKRGGAWMDECVGRSRICADPGKSVRLPVAYLVCNGTPPLADRPSLMTFREVETLFHEFGHGLQHMLTTVDCGLASGIRNIEWDAVELPSQFMENWCYDRATLLGLSRHADTGEPLPEALYEKILASRTYRAASQMLRQLYFAFLDLELHHQREERESPIDVQRRVAARTTVLPPLAEDRFLCSFGHIFAGGYAAGYYSYKWAEVLSADAFSAFEEVGLESAAVTRTGQRFRETVLALGGSRSPSEVFRQFRGRDPSTQALLRHAGLISDPAPALAP